MHLDADIEGNGDDSRALAPLLASPEVELTAITTVGDRHGRRAALARHALAFAGRSSVRVAGGGAFLDGGKSRKVVKRPP